MMRGELAVLSGRSNPKLAEAAARVAGATLTACDTRCHSDGEIAVDIGDNVRGNDVFVIQSTCAPGNDYLMELLILIDALKRASAERITAVLPYFGYARQDRKNAPRQPITAKLVANLITTAGADRVLTIDLHAGQIMGFFDLPVDNLYARPVLMKSLQEILAAQKITNGEDICVVSPDAGGVARARAYAKRLDAGLAIIDKRRSGPNEVAEMNVVGDVNKKVCIIVDDMVDTAGTLAKAADALLENGALDVLACCTHPVLSGSAIERIEKSRISKLIVSDTIYHENLSNGTGSKRVVQLSVSGLLGEAMRRIHDETSVSTLFADQ